MNSVFHAALLNRNLPNDNQTVGGDRGVRLSGGPRWERQ